MSSLLRSMSAARSAGHQRRIAQVLAQVRPHRSCSSLVHILEKNPAFLKPDGPVCLVILDGNPSLLAADYHSLVLSSSLLQCVRNIYCPPHSCFFGRLHHLCLSPTITTPTVTHTAQFCKQNSWQSSSFPSAPQTHDGPSGAGAFTFDCTLLLCLTILHQLVNCSPMPVQSDTAAGREASAVLKQPPSSPHTSLYHLSHTTAKCAP